MWMRRASRGRLAVPLSWREVRGTEGFMTAGVVVGAVVAAAAGTGWEVGEEVVWPFVWGAASPFTSAMVN
jgi:hypothetical protein